MVLQPSQFGHTVRGIDLEGAQDKVTIFRYNRGYISEVRFDFDQHYRLLF